MLGSGDPTLEVGWRAAALRHAGEVGVVFRYDEPLSHPLQAERMRSSSRRASGPAA
jgi:starch synthase